MRLWKHARLVGTIVIVVALLAVAVWPEAVAVEVTSVSRGAMQVTIDEDGETRVRDRFVVSAPVAGRLQRIVLDAGDPVVCGRTVVARLSPPDSPLLDARSRAELAAAVDAAHDGVVQAEAERDRAIATAGRLRSSSHRLQALASAGAISRDELEAAEAASAVADSGVRSAQATVARLQHEWQSARARLANPSGPGRIVDVLAPVDGVVLKRLRRSESLVPAGEPLVEIGDPDQLEIVADLLSTDAVRVPVGAPVSIEQWGGSAALGGRLRLVEPSGFVKVSALGVEEQRVNVIIDIDDAAAGALGDGYRVEVRVVVWRGEDVLKVPSGTLFRRGTEWAAFVVDGGRARLRTVTIGQRNNEEVQVVGGLNAGDAILLHPPDTVEDGTRLVRRK